MGPKILLQKALEQAGHCLKHVRISQLTQPTPCKDWDLKQLLNHLVYEVLWIPDMVRGKTIAEVGDRYEGDVLGDNPAAAWRHAATSAMEAIRDADEKAMAHLSYDDVPVGDYLMEIAGEILIHTWDVGQAMHCSVLFDDAIVKAVYENIRPRMEDYRKSGLFGEPVAVADDADLQTKLLGLLGRSAEKWQASVV